MKKAAYIMIIISIVFLGPKLKANEQSGVKKSPLVFSHLEGNYKFYKGEITVSGKIYLDPYNRENTYLGGVLRMYVDNKTRYLIPRENDGRSAWFIFRNDGTLFAKMKIDENAIKTKCFSGYAKIQITNYQQYIGEGEGEDRATLFKVIEKKDYSYKKCKPK